MVRLVRGIGWTLVTAGSVILLYVVYVLWFTGLETAQEQRDLGQHFETLLRQPVATPTDPQTPPEPLVDEPIELGEAFAALWFERDGERVINSDILYVIEGTSVADLKRGPGHYVDSAVPGGEGNLGIAGHRTTYGSPFWALDELTEGDTIHVVDRAGTEWVYAFREQRVVRPTDVWVVNEPDPLGLGAPMITLTTCHPRASAAQRLIAWGELIGPATT